MIVAAMASIVSPFFNLTSTPFRLTEVLAVKPALVVPALRPSAESAPAVPLSRSMLLPPAELSTRRPLSLEAVTPVSAVPDPELAAPAPSLILATIASKSLPWVRAKLTLLIFRVASAANPAA
ncbi:hypothetical protein D3C76_1093010 [compost metagenome]